MTPRIWKFVSAATLLASVFVFNGDTDSADGRIDLVCQQGNVDASSGLARGGFSLRSLDRTSSERIALGAPYETVSLPVPAGVYTLDWQAEVSLDTAGAALAQATALVGLPRVVIVSAGHATTVRVRIVPSIGVDKGSIRS